MNIKLSASLLVVFATAGLAQAQHKPALWHGNDPGLDPKVAATLLRQGAAKWSCTELPGRGGFTDSSIIWPDGIVYYEFDANMPAEQIQIAKQGMDIWMFRGPAPNVRFLQHTPGDTSHPWTRISFITSGSNNADVGIQFPSPGDVHQRDYADAYTMAHELGHTLGFYHEQSRPDRNTYITVLWSHIEPGSESNFDVHSSIDWPAAALSTPYDFDSIMHYPPTWFSTCANPHCDEISSCATFAVNPPNTAWQCEMEDHDHLSTNDVQDMINVYGQRTTPIQYVDPLSPNSTASGTITNPFPLLLMVPPSTALQDVYLSAGAHVVPNSTRLASKGRYAPHGGTATIY